MRPWTVQKRVYQYCYSAISFCHIEVSQGVDEYRGDTTGMEKSYRNSKGREKNMRHLAEASIKYTIKASLDREAWSQQVS